MHFKAFNMNLVHFITVFSFCFLMKHTSIVKTPIKTLWDTTAALGDPLSAGRLLAESRRTTRAGAAWGLSAVRPVRRSHRGTGR